MFFLSLAASLSAEIPLAGGSGIVTLESFYRGVGKHYQLGYLSSPGRSNPLRRACEGPQIILREEKLRPPNFLQHLQHVFAKLPEYRQRRETEPLAFYSSLPETLCQDLTSPFIFLRATRTDERPGRYQYRYYSAERRYYQLVNFAQSTAGRYIPMVPRWAGGLTRRSTPPGFSFRSQLDVESTPWSRPLVRSSSSPQQQVSVSRKALNPPAGRKPHARYYG